MAITSTGLNAATNKDYIETKAVENKTALGKDDFMKLLLAQMQHQDPTSPMETDQILSQTSQLATLEASTNTTKALEQLSASMLKTQEFSTISAIGKRADLGSDAITYDKGSNSVFEIYFPNDVEGGVVDIKDAEGKVVATMSIIEADIDGNYPENVEAGVYKFEWDGSKDGGGSADSGIYHVSALYNDTEHNQHTTRLGSYPIESVKFDGGETYFKLGSSYVPLSNIKEVY